MKKKRKIACWLFCLFFLFCCTADAAACEIEENTVYEKSGAPDMYDSLGSEAKNLLSQAGVDSAQVGNSFHVGKLFDALSRMLQDKLKGPLKAMASLASVIILCRITGCFESTEVGKISAMVGAIACISVVVVHLTKLIRSAKTVIDSASVFLASAVPVYSALLLASGNAAAGASYSLLTLTAANAIPVLSTGVLIPLLNIFLALTVTSAICGRKLDRLTGKLYAFGKWMLVLAVTVFSGALSLQAFLNQQADTVSVKATKLIASSAIPIVGGAFGDALGAIKASMQVVKSGVGAFGVLASLCIFLPVIAESILWIAVLSAGELMGEIFEIPEIGGLLGSCVLTAKMVLAVVVSTAAVSVVCAAVVLFLRGGL